MILRTSTFLTLAGAFFATVACDPRGSQETIDSETATLVSKSPTGFKTILWSIPSDADGEVGRCWYSKKGRTDTKISMETSENVNTYALSDNHLRNKMLQGAGMSVLMLAASGVSLVLSCPGVYAIPAAAAAASGPAAPVVAPVAAAVFSPSAAAGCAYGVVGSHQESVATLVNARTAYAFRTDALDKDKIVDGAEVRVIKNIIDNVQSLEEYESSVKCPSAAKALESGKQVTPEPVPVPSPASEPSPVPSPTATPEAVPVP